MIQPLAQSLGLRAHIGCDQGLAQHPAVTTNGVNKTNQARDMHEAHQKPIAGSFIGRLWAARARCHSLLAFVRHSFCRSPRCADGYDRILMNAGKDTRIPQTLRTYFMITCRFRSDNVTCFESMWQAAPPASSHLFLRRRAGFASVYNGFVATQLQAFRCVVSRNKGKNLTGIWHKMHALSESLDPTADLFELSFVARQGAKLATTVTVHETDEYMKSSIKVRRPERRLAMTP
jgi:hypothetical protein